MSCLRSFKILYVTLLAPPSLSPPKSFWQNWANASCKEKQKKEENGASLEYIQNDPVQNRRLDYAVRRWFDPRPTNSNIMGIRSTPSQAMPVTSCQRLRSKPSRGVPDTTEGGLQHLPV